MAHFPLLRTGAVTQYPSGQSSSNIVTVLRYLDGSEQRWRETAGLRKSWTLHLSMASEEEVALIEEFFVEQQGQSGKFTFTDPYDGVAYPNCSFESDSLRTHLFGDEWAGTTLVIRSNTPS